MLVLLRKRLASQGKGAVRVEMHTMTIRLWLAGKERARLGGELVHGQFTEAWEVSSRV